MAYPVILYDATSGSDTAPADAIATGSAASGTGAATTIDLGGTFDLTDAADDDSDYIWCSTTAGERHLFQITSFTGGAATCTAVVVAEAIGATTFSGANWHINGSRLTLESDTSRRDHVDWGSGWTVELEAGTYVLTAAFNPGASGITWNSTKPPIEIRAASGAASRPVIDVRANANVLHVTATAKIKATAVKLACSTGGSTGSYINFGEGSLTLLDCVIDVTGGTAVSAVHCQYNNRSLALVRCYITGGTQCGIFASVAQYVLIDSCVVDGQGGTYYSVSGIETSAMPASVMGSLVVGCSGVGIRGRTNSGDNFLLWTGNTVVDCGSHGLEFVNEATSSNTAPNIQGLVANNISALNGGYGFVTPTAGNMDLGSYIFAGNATYSNTSGAYSGQVTASVGCVTCSVDPFTDSSIGDYTLNNTAGGGADLRNAAYPAQLPSGA